MGHHAGDHKLRDALILQFFEQVGLVKGIILALFDDRAFGYVDVSADLTEGIIAGDQVAPPACHHGAVVGIVDVACEEDRQISLRIDIDKLVYAWDDRGCAGDISVRVCI